MIEGEPARATSAFEAERPRLVALAYRMLGTPDDADDVVQDAWLRWQPADRDAIDRPAAWLTTVTTRLAIDRLRSARARPARRPARRPVRGPERLARLLVNLASRIQPGTQVHEVR